VGAKAVYFVKKDFAHYQNCYLGNCPEELGRGSAGAAAANGRQFCSYLKDDDNLMSSLHIFLKFAIF
jgi:hypothetical protein